MKKIVEQTQQSTVTIEDVCNMTMSERIKIYITGPCGAHILVRDSINSYGYRWLDTETYVLSDNTYSTIREAIRLSTGQGDVCYLHDGIKVL